MIENIKNPEPIEILVDFLVPFIKWNNLEFDPYYIVKQAINETVNHLEIPECFDLENLEVSIVLGDDKMLTKLNKQYKNKDGPTNVLSFPLMEEYERVEQLTALGDIVISFETLQNESLDQNIEFKDHLSHLTVHGMLHLLGYDHQKEKEAKVMEELEIKILKDLGVKNPYQ